MNARLHRVVYIFLVICLGLIVVLILHGVVTTGRLENRTSKSNEENKKHVDISFVAYESLHMGESCESIWKMVGRFVNLSR